MAIPTIFSDVAANPQVAKSEPQGVLAQKGVVTVPASTGTGVKIGLVRFQKGFTLVGLAVKSSDLDTSTNVTLDVGYNYDTTSSTSDDNAFFSALDIGQDAGSVVWPIADGLLTGVSFTAEEDGYISVTTGGGATTTAGTISFVALYTYDAA